MEVTTHISLTILTINKNNHAVLEIITFPGHLHITIAAIKSSDIIAGK